VRARCSRSIAGGVTQFAVAGSMTRLANSGPRLSNLLRVENCVRELIVELDLVLLHLRKESPTDQI